MDPRTVADDYLARLDAAASHLASDRRADLLADVREHIELALAEAGAVDAAAVQNVLDRLGSPDDIVAAEAGEPIPKIVAAGREPTPRTIESRALLMLTIGALVMPFAGPLVGLWLASGSTRWSLAQKRTAALIVFILLAMPAVFIIPALAGGEITWVFRSGGLLLLPLVPLAGFVAAAYLFVSTNVVLTVSRRS